MQTKSHEIDANELKAVRDFLIGLTDEVRIPRTTRPARRVPTAVPVHNGITRLLRTRSGPARPALEPPLSEERPLEVLEFSRSA